MGIRTGLESVIAGVVAANFVGSDAATLVATLVASVVGTLSIDSPTILNIDGSIFSRGSRTTSDGTTGPVNVLGVITVETEDFDSLEGSLSLDVGVAVVRDASKGTIEVSFMLK